MTTIEKWTSHTKNSVWNSSQGLLKINIILSIYSILADLYIYLQKKLFKYLPLRSFGDHFIGPGRASFCVPYNIMHACKNLFTFWQQSFVSNAITTLNQIFHKKKCHFDWVAFWSQAAGGVGRLSFSFHFLISRRFHAGRKLFAFFAAPGSAGRSIFCWRRRRFRAKNDNLKWSSVYQGGQSFICRDFSLLHTLLAGA